MITRAGRLAHAHLADLPAMSSQPLTAELLAAQDAVVLVTDHSVLDYASSPIPLIVDAGSIARNPTRSEGLMPTPGASVLATGGGFDPICGRPAGAGATARVLGGLKFEPACASRVFDGDIRAVLRRRRQGAGIVFHQAALGSVPRSLADPATSISVNVGGTATLFAAARDAGSACRLRFLVQCLRG
jgi:hypothetical protein